VHEPIGPAQVRLQQPQRRVKRGVDALYANARTGLPVLGQQPVQQLAQRVCVVRGQRVRRRHDVTQAVRRARRGSTPHVQPYADSPALAAVSTSSRLKEGSAHLPERELACSAAAPRL
jgi:hypothetical protein